MSALKTLVGMIWLAPCFIDAIETYSSFFTEGLPQISIEDYQINLVIFDPETVEILQWIK